MDTKQLLAKQVREQIEALCRVLGTAEGQKADPGHLDQAAVASRMLSGTLSLVGFAEWEQALVGYVEVLTAYRDAGVPWDERVAGVTSELAQAEETLADELDNNDALDAINVDGIALQSLRNEMVAVIDAMPESVPEPAPEVQSQPAPAASPAAPGVASTPPTPQPQAVSVAAEDPRRAIQSAVANLMNCDLGGDPAAAQHELARLSLLASSLQRTVAGSGEPDWSVSLSTLAESLDHAGVAVGHDRRCRVTFKVTAGDETTDRRILELAEGIIRNFAADIVSRFDGEAIEISIFVSVNDGALRVRVSDTLDQFLRDSPIDMEDQLAFYPSLRAVNRTLRFLNGVLWVEPADDPECRFAFSLPASIEREPLLVWGDEFAMRAGQFSHSLPLAEENIMREGGIEHVRVDGKRVPLMRLDSIYTGARAVGDTIIVAGALERRIAFVAPREYQNGFGSLNITTSDWFSAPHMSARTLSGSQLPVVDVDHLISAYLQLIGTMGSTDSSGGLGGDSQELERRQATSLASAEPAPAENDSTSQVDVLVVEQNETTQRELSAVLRKANLNVHVVGDVASAGPVLATSSPKLIISEFRMPTMAAKEIVDLLKRDGRTTPVLVTTSQTGRTAELLVEKLGAQGYLNKPIVGDQVSSRVQDFLVRDVQV